MRKSQLLVEKTIKMSSMGGMNDRGLSQISVSEVFTASKCQTKTFKAYSRIPTDSKYATFYWRLLPEL